MSIQLMIESNNFYKLHSNGMVILLLFVNKLQSGTAGSSQKTEQYSLVTQYDQQILYHHKWTGELSLICNLQHDS